MNKREQDIIKAALKEALHLPVDNLDKVDPTKLTKLAQKTDVVIGENDGSEILDADDVEVGMPVYSKDKVIGTVIELVPAFDYPELYSYDDDNFLPSHDHSDEGNDFFSSINPDEDSLMAVKLNGNLGTVVGPYNKNYFYCKPIAPNAAPQSFMTAAVPHGVEGPGSGPTMTEDSQFPTATPEQQQSLFDLQNWAEELGLDIGVGEETVGDIIKFGFQGAESWVTILVDPNGTIKVSGHTIKTFNDFQDIVNFFND